MPRGAGGRAARARRRCARPRRRGSVTRRSDRYLPVATDQPPDGPAVAHIAGAGRGFLYDRVVGARGQCRGRGGAARRSEERRVGTGWGSTVRSRWVPVSYKKKLKKKSKKQIK